MEREKGGSGEGGEGGGELDVEASVGPESVLEGVRVSRGCVGSRRVGFVVGLVEEGGELVVSIESEVLETGELSGARGVGGVETGGESTLEGEIGEERETEGAGMFLEIDERLELVGEGSIGISETFVGEMGVVVAKGGV